MLTSTERVGRTRLRVSAGVDGARCRVRSALTSSDPSAPTLRPMVVDHDARSATVSLVPEGAVLLAGDAIEIDVTVDAGARLHLIEPAGTVAFDMRGRRARWDVRVQVAAGALLTWAGEPFVVAAGADVDRALSVSLAPGAAVVLRDTLVLGRYGEGPGRIRQRTSVSDVDGPLLVEDLPLDSASAPGLLGGNRVMASVLRIGPRGTGGDGPNEDRYQLDYGGELWRCLGVQAHEADLSSAWSYARRTLE